MSAQAESAAKATALQDPVSPARLLRKDAGQRLALLGQQVLNAALDLLFLAIWAALSAGQKLALDYFDAPLWIQAVGIFGDVSTFAIVACYITVDVIKSVRQMWATGRD